MMSGSMSPISRIEALRRRYCWPLRVSGRTVRTGRICSMGTIIPLGSNAIFTDSGMSGPLAADMLGQELRHGGEIRRPQDGHEARIGEELLERAADEEQPRLADLGLVDQQALLGALALVGLHER